MNVNNFAPVLIPTLNRFEHFKRCLESLERCTGACKTEVFVALDYPPAEKYKPGWEAIDLYLSQKEKDNAFQKLNVIRRERNYGVGHPNGNYEELQRRLFEQYDSIIITEDDNEFSPCYLDYMNKCLERFKDDPRIILICGYNHHMTFPEYYKNNYYITNSGCAWGIGKWASKNKGLEELYNLDKLGLLLKDKESYEKLKKKCPQAINMILTMLKTKDIWGDSVIGIYAHLYDKFYVLPRLSMVRNYGNDMSGVHSKHSDKNIDIFYTSQEIDKNTTFDYTDDIFTYAPHSINRDKVEKPVSIYVVLRNLYIGIFRRVDLFLYKHFNYIPRSKWL